MLVPPVKIQGIKTKLVDTIRTQVPDFRGIWIEPFCGSCVVPLNIQPQNAILGDTNKYIIDLYARIQHGAVTPAMVREHLEHADVRLRKDGERYYYFMRARFNRTHDPLDFLFLNRSCFNGVMRFNNRGEFNVPFCRKPEKFSPSYITRIVNYVAKFAEVSQRLNWSFVHSSFEQTLGRATKDDFIYADPPYIGRNNQYHGEWDDSMDVLLGSTLQKTPAKFLLSTWASDPRRTNFVYEKIWRPAYYTITVEHFYHVGPYVGNRHAVTEALVRNYPVAPPIEVEQAVGA